jgi:hypothetical protein
MMNFALEENNKSCIELRQQYCIPSIWADELFTISLVANVSALTGRLLQLFPKGAIVDAVLAICMLDFKNEIAPLPSNGCTVAIV